MCRGKVVAPSIADGGPGIDGWSSVFPWLQRFLIHCRAAGTMPDVLTWHVSKVGHNATELLDQHAALAAWAVEAGVNLPPIGHNEVALCFAPPSPTAAPLRPKSQRNWPAPAAHQQLYPLRRPLNGKACRGLGGGADRGGSPGVQPRVPGSA